MHAPAREILLLAAEDAFEFERLREAGPLTADIDPETTAAEIAEFEALGIPMPDELDGLRRELEHAPKVRDAIRSSALALRRSGGASASALVALGPQNLVGPGAVDPRLLALMDPRLTALLDARGAPGPAAAGDGGAGRESTVRRARRDEREARQGRGERERKLATAAVIGSTGAVAAEVLRAPPAELDDDWDDERDDLDEDDDDAQADETPADRRASRGRPAAKSARGRTRDDGRRRADDYDDEDDDDDEEDDDFEDRLARERRPPHRSERARPKRARPVQDDWGSDDDDSLVAVTPRPQQDNKVTWILGGISAVAVLALLWMAFNRPPPASPDPALAQQQQLPQPLPQPQPQPQPEPPPVDPALAAGLPPTAPVEATAPTPTATTRGSGISGSSRSSSGSGSSGGGSSSGGSGGGVNPFGNYTPPGKDPVNGGQTQPAGGGPTQPAGGGQPAPAPAPGEQTPPTDGQAQPAQPPAEEPKPAEEAKPPEPELTKSKMTPAIRDAIVGKVGAAQQCYTDALVGKPDLAGRVMFTVSLDQDGVVTKVDIIKDEVKYGVAKCVAKKIRTWTLPSAGIPIIFDLPPFDFKP